MAETHAPPRRWLFTAAILTGSFLLFLVQPMVARMALPRLGGAPNVWNSAMLVYQALLLGGYAYAHAIGRFPLARQGMIHLAVLVLAGLTLPLSLAEIAPPAPGWEALWVPWLFLLTVGPAFFAVSAQAPLVQRWFAAHPHAGNPYPLYAASNLGSFAGLLAYPLLLEPALGLGAQSWLWSAGYGVLVLLVAFVVLSRHRHDFVPDEEEHPASSGGKTGWKAIGLWLALSAIPSGLMLSTTTYLTTDIMAMPLLWVIPLGLYLLSFSIAFAENRWLAGFIVLIAPVILLVDGSVAMFTAGRADLIAAFASVILLFVIAVALHARLYDHRPPPAQLTRFYLVMSAGGALGGMFTALVAPLVFDWTWEHPLLILGAAVLLPLGPWKHYLRRIFRDPRMARMALALSLFIVFTGSAWLYRESLSAALGTGTQLAAFGAIVLFAMVLAAQRLHYVMATLALLASLGGFSQLQTSAEGLRERSYFGIYAVQENEEGDRLLMHGTTIHGIQRSEEYGSRTPTAYYGRTSGIGLALQQAPELFGENARIGVVGLGVGTLACYRQPGQEWTFFEIDPVVHHYSTRGLFTFLDQCAPDEEVVIGDARLELEGRPEASFDLLAIDAFSSDAIPLHLLTREALDIYFDRLAADGVLMIHISNRFVALEPVLARLAQEGGYASAIRSDVPEMPDIAIYPSGWVAMARDPARLAQVTQDGEWRDLDAPKGAVWTDEYASILRHLIWENFL